MMRKVLIFSFAVAYLCLGGISFANNSPADMLLQAEKIHNGEPFICLSQIDHQI
jgi:hypothetical protein